MTGPDRVLRPLEEAGPSIDRLETYESPAALGEALRATWHAVEATLRRRLRAGADVPDRLRMSALSPTEMPIDALLTELRRRDLISLPLAGRIHEFRHALERVEAGEVRAADADVALDVVAAVRAEIGRVGGGGAVPDPALIPAPDADQPTVEDDVVEREDSRPSLRPLYIAAGVGVLLLISMVLVFTLGRGSPMERGIAAFESGDADAAEQQFRVAIERDEAAVTARLYLARILREQQRRQEAADQLRAAARLAPEDAAVRRELGYLFLDLGQPDPAVEQFRLAVELEPDEALNWVGVVLALRQAEDPAAANEWLRRAPAAARSLLEARGR
jgi:tetratricopeptide (TPR) repeat protein